MFYTIIYLPKAEKYLVGLDDKNYTHIKESITELKKNPYRPRPLVDIIKLRGHCAPPMYRLRVGRHRLEYLVDEDKKEIYVLNAFLRSSDSDCR